MRPEAREILTSLINEFGKAIVRTPSSCRMYLVARLGKFPEERDLLTAALGRGIPEQILQHAGTDDYDAKLADLARDLSAATGAEPTAAAEAVTAWAEALRRPPGYQKPTAPNRVYPDDEKPNAGQERAVRHVMALIAAAGGFLGTAIGSGAVLTIFAVTDAAVGGPPAVQVESEDPEIAAAPVALLIVVKMFVCGIAGGVSAGLGWMFGKGDEKPWAGFAAAFGAGLTMSLILLSYTWTIPKLMVVVCCVAGATFTAAARGGYQH